MNKKIFILAITIILIISLVIGSTFAAYSIGDANANGSLVLSLDILANISERDNNNIKYVKITTLNDETNMPLYTRVKAITNDFTTIEFQNLTNTNWDYRSDGYVYFMNAIYPGDESTELEIKMNKLYETNLENNTNFNVTVVFETYPVIYDEKANPLPYYEWNE